MATPTYAQSLCNLTKRIRLSPSTSSVCQVRGIRQRPAISRFTPSTQSRQESTDAVSADPSRAQSAAGVPQASINSAQAEQELLNIRLPRAVQATYLEPLRHKFTHKVKTCDLQIRSYSVRNLEVFADFAVRAAYYLKLPARGPVPLPRIVERWTVPRSNFIFKKSQENFERITVRRHIEIYDGHPETVAAWLAYLQKRRYYGVGLKANVWEHGGLEVAKDMDAEAERISEKLGAQLDLVGGKRSLMRKEEEVLKMVDSGMFKARWGAETAMGGAQGAPYADQRIVMEPVDAGAAGAAAPTRRRERRG
ncbi:hypothetical protein BAUCODRAFT_156168 [Baudoinia panamericana UAMH 10762]|uniref:Small ribosomal subunit protein uS10m n=1 Tax=Baudoinia panamericana (strain UAMH 10762) TaxID=717646 RepID=M2MLJ1_BAUPA|nr:uncharacterized protein BAUCODRAFT_156168 [Baudoinia panamericana UAMH 10762]EMC97511.1 hypothetical protein BAUCODRAFT_156168 [Baudoinia panamericana UAMH 10762]